MVAIPPYVLRDHSESIIQFLTPTEQENIRHTMWYK